MEQAQAADILVETRAYLDGLMTILEAQEGRVDIDAFALRQLIKSADSKLDQAVALLAQRPPLQRIS